MTFGFGRIVNVSPTVTVHTPLDPDKVAEPAPVYGGMLVRGETGPPGLALNMSGMVTNEYVFAPPAVRVMVLGEPLKACEHKVGLLNCPVKEGGGNTFTVVWAELVQAFKLPITV